MIDFRYHALTLVAVFVALAIGLLLGVTIGDSGLVSDFRGDVRESLKGDLKNARKDSSAAKAELEQQDRFLSKAFPQIVDGKLGGRRVGVIGSGGATRLVLPDVQAALEPAGATVAYAGELRKQPDYGDIATELKLDPAIMEGPQAAEGAARIGKAVGRRVAKGRASETLRSMVFDRFSGDFRRVRHIVLVRGSVDLPKAEAKLFNAFERGIVEGSGSSRRRAVGVERTDAKDSQIHWYESAQISSVDNVDKYSGRYALVLVLGGAEGDYGLKKSADAIIPLVAR